MKHFLRWLAIMSGCGMTALLHADSPAMDPLLALARQCVERRDSSHPLFHGCLDWHSAVHGHWALLWGGRTSQNQPLLTWLSHRLTPALLAEEMKEFQQHLARQDHFELPYGHAWFLHLAQEGERTFGDGRFLPLARIIYASLLEFARNRGGDPLATDYQNSSWALFHLARWARFQQLHQDWQEIRVLALARLQPIRRYPDFSNNRGFFDPAALALLLLEEVEAWETLAWQIIRENWRQDSLQPLSQPFKTAHQGGLNYSRSWGIAALHRREKDSPSLQAWHAHMAAMAETMSDWGRDYQRYGHWVAQFGVFALSMPPK